MSSRNRFVCALLTLVCELFISSGFGRDTSSAKVAHANRAVMRLPLAFEENRGQGLPDADFLVRTAHYGASLNSQRIVLRAHSRTTAAQSFKQVSLEFVGCSHRHAKPEGRLAGVANYIFGSDPRNWITGVFQYRTVSYSDVYPGIDLLYRGTNGQLEYDFIVRPGATPDAISLRITPSKNRLVESGTISVHGSDGEIVFGRPYAYQMVGGEKTQINVSYSSDHGLVKFRTGSFDHRLPLIIDPYIVYASYLGGSPEQLVFPIEEYASATGVDAAGNLYIAGQGDADFPVTPGAFQTTSAFGNVFISKVDPTGTSLIYSTFISGLRFGRIPMAVGSDGSVYLGGEVSQLPSNPTFPVTQGAYQTSPRAIGIVKLNTDGKNLVFATYFGGSSPLDTLFGLAIDNSKNVYITGSTNSNDFPVQNAFQSTLKAGSGGMNAFVSKLNSSGQQLLYSTYLGGSSNDSASAIAVDSTGNAFVTGSTNSADFPTQNALQPVYAGSVDAFVSKFDPSGALLYSTFYGGNSFEQSNAIVADSFGNAYFAGISQSSNLPLQNALQTSGGVFIAALNPAGSSLLLSSYFGGPYPDSANSVALDSAGNLYVAGSTSSPSFPLKNALESDTSLLPSVGQTGFVAEIGPAPFPLLFSSLIGTVAKSQVTNSSGSVVRGIAVDSASPANIYVVGETGDGFGVVNALQPQLASGTVRAGTDSDAFFVKIAPDNKPAASILPAIVDFGVQQVHIPSGSSIVTLRDVGTAPLNVSAVSSTNDLFAVANNCNAPIAISGGTCTIAVSFTPNAIGPQSGALMITDDATGSPHKVALSGSGGVAVASLNPTSLGFSGQAVGTTSGPQAITLTNTGTFSLNISRISTTGDFTETNNCGAGVTPSQSCTVSVVFEPKSSGSQNGTVAISDNASDTPQMATLVGSTDPANFAFAPASGSSASATISAGQTATYRLIISSSNGFSGSVNVSCSGLPTASSCNPSPNSFNLVPGGQAIVTVSVATTARSSTIGQLKPHTNWPAAALLNSASFSAVLLVGVMGTYNRTQSRRKRRSSGLLAMMVILAFLLPMSACGGGQNPPSTPPTVSGTPAGSYTVVISGSAGSISSSTNLSLTVN